MLLISGEFNIISNYVSQNCVTLSSSYSSTNSSDDVNDVFCVLDWVTMFSLVNKTNQNEINDIQHFLNFLGLIGVIVFMLYLRKTQKEFSLKCDWREATPADYTISVKNLPKDLKNIEQELKDYFSNIDNKAYDVQKINLCYDLTERAKLHSDYKKKLKTKKQIIKGNKEKSKELDEINRDLLFKEEEMRNYDINLQQNSLSFCGIAFVTFNTQKEMKEIIDKSLLTFIDRLKIFFNKKVNLPHGFVFQGSRLIIEQAPEPSEILFHNLHSDSQEKVKLRAITFFLTVLELTAFGAAIYYLLSFQNDYFTNEISSLKESQTSESGYTTEYYNIMIMLYMSSGSISLFIVVINNVFITLITKSIVKMGRYSTYTRKKINLAVRLSVVNLEIYFLFYFHRNYKNLKTFF